MYFGKAGSSHTFSLPLAGRKRRSGRLLPRSPRLANLTHNARSVEVGSPNSLEVLLWELGWTDFGRLTGHSKSRATRFTFLNLPSGQTGLR